MRAAKAFLATILPFTPPRREFALRMNWLNRAEAKFGHLAIPGLPRVIIGFNLLVFVLFKLDRHFLSWLTLEPSLVREGQVWRLVTFAFIPGFGPEPFDWFLLLIYLLCVL